MTDAPLPYVCTLHGNTVKDVADQCAQYEHNGGTMLLKSCLSCKNHVKPAKEKKGVFITPRQRQQYIYAAAQWWDTTGRHMVSQEKNSERSKRKFREATALSAAIITTGAKEVVIPSGIMNGRTFHNLNASERARVLKVWMHHYTEFQFADLSKREQQLCLDQAVKKLIEH